MTWEALRVMSNSQQAEGKIGREDRISNRGRLRYECMARDARNLGQI